MILCGLRPETIIEICGKGISFWTYQMSQEMVYRDMLFKEIEDRRGAKDRQSHSTVLQLQSELSRVKEKLSSNLFK
jgi:E3 ubiquitin-protein ligase CCNP1IP1